MIPFMKIFDASSIIGFYTDLGRPELLYEIREMGYQLKIPSGVYGELTGETFRTVKDAIEQNRIDILKGIDINKFIRLKNRYSNLKNGEIEVITWGEFFEDNDKKYYCILDDKKARKVAESFGISFTGTKGLLDFLLRKKTITSGEKEALLQQLHTAGFRL